MLKLTPLIVRVPQFKFSLHYTFEFPFSYTYDHNKRYNSKMIILIIKLYIMMAIYLIIR